MSNPSRHIYKLARTVNNLDALSEPKRWHRRAKNVLLGHILGRAGFWRKLWK